MPTSNRPFRLASRPVGLPKAGDWTLFEALLGEPAAGHLLLKLLNLPLDPAMRGWGGPSR